MMNSFTGNAEKVAFYIQHLRRLGISVLPPDVNKSSDRFSVDHKGQQDSQPQGKQDIYREYGIVHSGDPAKRNPGVVFSDHQCVIQAYLVAEQQIQQDQQNFAADAQDLQGR